MENTMTVEEVVKALENKLAEKGFASQEDVTKMQTAIEALKSNTELDAVKALATKLEGEIEALKEKGNESVKTAPKNFFQAVKAAVTDNAEFKRVVEGGNQTAPIHMTIKEAVTIGLDNTVYDEGSDSSISVTQNTGIISGIRKRILKYLSGGVSVGTLQGNKAMWIEELDEEGNPIFIGEGETKTQLSVRYEERDKRARKIGVHGKVTTEMMRNLPALVNYIQNNLMKRVDIATEDQLFDGGDSGDDLAGIIGYATAFDGGGLGTPAPSYADVFRGIALQVEKAHGIATAVYVRPEILAQMDVEKAEDSGVYLMPPFRAANGAQVAGMSLISTNGLPEGTDFVGGDLSVVNVLFSDNMSVQIGLDGNDFTKNLKTILVEQELVQFVSANDTQVLVKGDMESAIAAITVS
jgi:HK97 family phage major capsid protein